MRNRAVEYPHPVLNEYNTDYPDSKFSVNILSHDDTGTEIVIKLECLIECEGLMQTVARGDAKVILRLTCYRTSFRHAYDIKPNGTNTIEIAKSMVADSIDLQAMIIATRSLNKFKLSEFNADYFSALSFDIRKGDILACEPGIKIKLNTVLEKKMAGIVQIRRGANASYMDVHFSECDEERPELTNYIVITLPDEDYKNYALIMNKRHLKNGVERFLHASLIFPVITEAISKLRAEETTSDNDGEDITHYRGTIWAESIYEGLRVKGISDLSENMMSDCEIANILLGNVTGDSISNLMQKLTEWSTIREEDPTL